MFYHCDQLITKDYDVIVIGAGLAGMTAANKLAKNGRSVLLVEAHSKLGGYATWFNRKNHIFDVSLHGFPVGMKKTCHKYWSKEIADKIVPLKSVRFINPQFSLDTTYSKENFKELLVSHFELEPEKVESFFEKLEQMNFYDDQELTNRQLFESFFPGRNDVIRFLLEPIVYANGSTLDDQAITYGIVFSNFMSKGVYVYQGGTDQMIRKMQNILLDNDVDIAVKTPISKIEIEEGAVKGVWIRGHLVKAKAVLSNGNLKSTILDMAGKEHFSPDFISRVSSTRLNTSSCQVYMGIREGERLPFIGDLIFYSESEKFSSEELLSDKITGQTFSLYYPDMRPERGERYAIVSSSNARFCDWDGLSESDYLEKKKYIEERALETIEKLIPGVRDKIDYVESATPLTFKRYAHHPMGSSFGTKFEGLDLSMKLHHQVKGLFHAGSVGIIMSGWLGAANYGVIQSHEIEQFLE